MNALDSTAPALPFIKPKQNMLKQFSLLYVEDDIAVRDELAQFLARRVKTLYLAEDGKEGLTMFQQHRPDIVVTDILMPKMNGLEMAREIKCLHEDTPVIITTAFNEADFFIDAIEIGIDKYVLKPVQVDKLLAALQQLAWLLKARKDLKLSSAVFTASNQAIIVTDASNRIVAVNPAFCRITGYNNDEVIGRDPKFLSSGRQAEAFYREMWRHIEEHGHWQGEIWNRRRNGEVYPEWLTISVVPEHNGDVMYYVGIFSDISDRKQAEQQLYNLAHYDPLTHLPNRTLFQDRLQQAIAQAQRDHDTLSVLFIDLDRFKWVNDSYGHHVGDQLLQQVAARLRACVRQADTVSRLSGDEFIILLPRLERGEDAALVADEVLRALAEPFEINGHRIVVGCSIGISLYPDNGGDVLTLMKHADTAMYRVKESGRNHYQFFHSGMAEKVQARLCMERALRAGLEQHQFELHYQPLFESHSGELCAVEALLRWRHPEQGLLTPEHFLSVAEDSGLIIPLGEWVLQTAIAQVKQLQRQTRSDLTVCVNLSIEQLKFPGLAQKLALLLHDYAFDARCLELELPEAALLKHSDSAQLGLRQLAELGVGIAIDDFGAGYVTLTHLKYLPIDRLKIDRAFIEKAVQDEEGAAIMRALIAMARSLSLQITVEGLEQREHWDWLRAEALPVALQGFYLQRPMHWTELQQRLADSLYWTVDGNL